MIRQPPSQRAFASPDDYTFMSLLIIVFGLAFGGWLLWRFHHGAICAVVMQLAHGQMRFIALFTDRYQLEDSQVLAADPESVTFPQLVDLCRDIGLFFRIPAALLVGALGIVCFFRAAPARYCRNLDLERLVREQAKSFPAISAYAWRTLGLVGIAPGAPRPADPALNPAEWVARSATGMDGRFDERGARLELYRQLGALWRGPEHAEPHVRCLLAAFALHLAQRRADASELLGVMSRSVVPRQPEGKEGPAEALAFPATVVARADAILASREIGPPALALCYRHGFTMPALMTLLTEARRRAGVLAPAQFAFLKLVDRRLWYALHALGFPSEGPGCQTHPNPRVEAIGACDHWAAECAAGFPVLVPAIDRAVAAIRAAVGDDAPKWQKEPA